MNWPEYFGLFGFSMIKFLFTPFTGPGLGLNFFETYLSCVAGAFVSAAVVYFSSEFFMRRAQKKRLDAYQRAIAAGIVPKMKKKFTRTNKLIVRIKHRLGIVGVAFYAPLFLSIPVGAIITAKFYGKQKKTFPLIVLGIVVNGLMTTGIGYGLAYLF